MPIVGGQAGVIRAVRDRLGHDRQMEAGHLSVRGYRRIGFAGAPAREEDA